MKSKRLLYIIIQHTMEINTRIASLSDLETLKAFEQALIEVERPMDDSLRQEGVIYYYDLEELITSENSDILVALDEDKIIGCGYGLIKQHERDIFVTTDYGYIGFMYVKDEYRGKGVGQVILVGLNEWFKSRNMKEVRLKVYENNPKAIKAYEKAGFKKKLIEMKMNIE